MIFAPIYALDFKCIADRCRHSCCIGWEIDIDDATYEKYRECDAKGKTHLCNTVRVDSEGVRSFIMGEDDRCPHLTDGGLCNIIREFGDGYLCDICTEHPRFYHECSGRREMGVGLSCEAAARLILTSDGYAEIVPQRVESTVGTPSCTGASFDAALERTALYEILGQRNVPYDERVARLRELSGLKSEDALVGALRQVIPSLEYLNSDMGRILASSVKFGRTPFFDEMLERALAYFIFRYVSKSNNKEELRSSLRLSLALEQMLACMLNMPTMVDKYGVFECARMLSEEMEYNEDNIDTLRFVLGVQ